MQKNLEKKADIQKVLPNNRQPVPTASREAARPILINPVISSILQKGRQANIVSLPAILIVDAVINAFIVMSQESLKFKDQNLI